MAETYAMQFVVRGVAQRDGYVRSSDEFEAGRILQEDEVGNNRYAVQDETMRQRDRIADRYAGARDHAAELVGRHLDSMRYRDRRHQQK